MERAILWILTLRENRTTERHGADSCIFLSISSSVQAALSELGKSDFLHLRGATLSVCTQPLGTSQQPLAQPQPCILQDRMAAAKTEMILPALQLSEPLSFPHSPMDNYPKLEEVMMLSSAGTPFHSASAPEGAGFGSGEPGEQYDHLAGGKKCYN